MTKDVVCGMEVSDRSPKHKSEYHGTTYAFCSHECKEKFDEQPEAYAGKSMGGRKVAQ